MMQTYSFINSFCSLSRKKLKGKCQEIFSPVAWHKTAPKINVVESILTGLGDPPFPHNFKIHGSIIETPSAVFLSTPSAPLIHMLNNFAYGFRFAAFAELFAYA